MNRTCTCTRRAYDAVLVTCPNEPDTGCRLPAGAEQRVVERVQRLEPQLERLAVVVKHQIITRENVDHFYPNDALLGVETYDRY